MIPYLIYYLISFSLIFINKKLIPLIYSIIWFIFIGFRDGIGTDYYLTLQSVERSYIDFQNIQDSFIGYNLVDMELIHKLISSLLFYFEIDSNAYYIVIAFIEALIIYLLLKKINNKKLLLIFFILLYSLNLSMNITRMGFAILLLIFGTNFFQNQNKLFSILSGLSHYGSIPIILISSVRLKSFFWVIILGIIATLVYYYFIDLIILRWDTDDISGYKFKGYGFKLLFGSIILLLINYYIVKRSLLTQENLIIITLTIATYLFNPFLRYYTFYSTLILFSNIFKIDKKKIEFSKLCLLLSYPLLIFFGEWLEISRFVHKEGYGFWIPYRSLLNPF